MFCPKCGTRNDDKAVRCISCQAVIQTIPPRMGDDPTMRILLPVGRSGWAIAAGYAGLFSFLILPAPLALILGIIAIFHLKKRRDLHGMGRAVFGIVMGALGSAVLAYLAFDFLSHR